MWGIIFWAALMQNLKYLSDEKKAYKVHFKILWRRRYSIRLSFNKNVNKRQTNRPVQSKDDCIR